MFKFKNSLFVCSNDSKIRGGKKMKFTEKEVPIYYKRHPLILIIKLFVRIKPNQFPVFLRTPKVRQSKACGDEYMLLMC